MFDVKQKKVENEDEEKRAREKGVRKGQVMPFLRDLLFKCGRQEEK
jgi:hypothetical protein